MKFRIDKKDLIIFIIYCIALLYICGLVISNFAQIMETGEFYGMLPFKAFSSNYLPITLLLFICILIMIFTSVSSYIFDKEKGMGVGLKIGKKESDGYAKWATDKDIKNAKNVEQVSPKDTELKGAGIPLINNKKGMYVDNGDYHNLVLGSTGSGKTETLVKPMVNLLARKGESMVITDPKGEIYRYTLKNLESKGYNVILLNFRDPEKGNTWNPLGLPYEYHIAGNKDKSTELINDVALNMFVSDTTDDPFWEKTASDYFAGLALAIFEDAKREEININSINYMSTIGDEKYGNNSSYIKEYFMLKGETSRPYIFAASTINAPSDTKGGILSTFNSKIRIFSATDKLSKMLAASNFDMSDIGRKKTAVFLLIHDEKKTYHSLMTIFIKQCYEVLIDVAQENGGKLPFRTNFILDEFANMPALKDVDAMVSAARSREIRFTFIIQNFAQLSQVYGEHIAEVIKGNCGNMIYLITTEIKALEEISKMCGEVKSSEKEKTSSTPLVTVSDLQKLKMFQAIIKRLRTDPFKTDLMPNYKIDWGENYPLGDFPNCKHPEVEIFDMKKFVVEQKPKNNDMLGGQRFNPFGMGSGLGPGLGSGFGQSGLPTLGGMNQRPNQMGNVGPGSMMNSGMNAGMNPAMQPRVNPGMNQNLLSNPLSNMPFGDMDVEAIMKDIDDKIKEYEDKQKAEKESTTIKNIIDNKNIESMIEELEKSEIGEETAISIPQENKENKENKENRNTNKKIIVDTTSKIVSQSSTTDDEFYDDFFD